MLVALLHVARWDNVLQRCALQCRPFHVAWLACCMACRLFERFDVAAAWGELHAV
jgi:hypothetical protein